MHLSEGEIRTYLDGQLDPDAWRQVEDHLAACPGCRRIEQDARIRSARIEASLNNLQSPQAHPISARIARQRLEQRIQTQTQENPTMLKRLYARVSRPVWVAGLVIVLLAVSLAFPSVRAAANNFLRLFRVEQVRVLPVDFEQMPGQMASSDSLEALFKNQVDIKENGEAERVADAQEAARLTGMNVRLPSALQDPALYIQKGGSLALTMDVPLMNEVLKDMGHADLKLPDNLQGKQVNVLVPASIIAMYGDCPEPNEEDIEAAMAEHDSLHSQDLPECTTFMQMPSPIVDAPEDLDIEQLGRIYLELLGMEPAKAADFAQTIDWSSTFVLPMPSNFANYQNMTVDGVQATFIRTHKDDVRGYMLLWVKDGILYSLTGPGGGDAAMDIAGTIQ